MKREIERLRELRREFGAAPAAAKRALVERLGRGRARDAALLLRAHEELLYLCAYPDDQRVQRAAEAALRRLFGRPGPALRAALADSGVAGGAVRHSFSFELLEWLLRAPDADVALCWDEGSAGEALDELLGALVPAAERDGLMSTALSTQAWLERAAGRGPAGLRWLLDALGRLGLPPLVRDRLMEALALCVVWRPAAGHSRTFCRFPVRPLFCPCEPLVRSVALRDVLDQPVRLPAPRPVAAARELIAIARAALAVRHRETDPVTYANPREVYLLELDRGVDVALFGMQPERRLPIESYFGFVAARNRVPIAYGGGWVLADRCEIGVNLFETFRGGESAFVFAQILRAYRWLFDVRVFRVDPFQFGADNEEAIRSGAFWFYYRLGFRPTQTALRRLAETQAARIQNEPGYRSPPAMLRRLAGAQLALVVDERAARSVEVNLPALGLRVSRWIAERFGGDRDAARRAAAQRVARAAGVRDLDRWAEPERAAFEGLAPLGAMVPGLGRWPLAERREVVDALRAKGAARERDYCLRLRRCERLLRAWAALARGRA